MANAYDVGDVVRLSAAFTNSAGTAVDPSSVTVQYRQWLVDPASFTTLVYGVNSVVKASVGNYYHDLAVNSDGEWRYRWNGLGVNAAGAEERFMVRVRGVG